MAPFKAYSIFEKVTLESKYILLYPHQILLNTLSLPSLPKKEFSRGNEKHGK